MSAVPFFVRAATLVLLTALAVPAGADPLSLILPTSNDALLRGDPSAFFQYTDRNFEGVRSRPWQGGQYGFVRNARRTAAGIVHTRFHEGVDIQAMYRDRYDEPLDTVRTIDDGYVVYVNDQAGRSTYGKYVVVEHWWSGSPFYSLYAHLNSVHVEPGMLVEQGDELGRLGYTGRGINRRRAHLHFEINMLLNRNFQHWFEQNFSSRNWHDVFNGINLAGMDVTELYLTLEEDSTLTIEQFLNRQTPYYSVSVPLERVPDIIDRYEWLLDWSELRGSGERQRSWEIVYTRTNVPIGIRPSPKHVEGFELSHVRTSEISHALVTSGRVVGQGDGSYLGSSGERYVSLLTTQGGRADVVEFDRPQFRTVSETGTRLRPW